MSGFRKLSFAVATTFLVAGYAGGASADTNRAAQNKRGWQANAQLVYVPPAAPVNPREPAGVRNALSLCDQCPPMIVLGVGF